MFIWRRKGLNQPPGKPAGPDIENAEQENTMQSWVCTICQYVYDPSAGDPVNEVPPEVPFEDLLEDWSCPVCKAVKRFFVPY